METSRHVLETVFFVVMAAWSLGSVIFALPLWRLRRSLNRCNQGLWFANWAVFDAGRERAEICVYPLEYRDRVGETTGEWTVVMSGRRWAWHVCFWQPERRLSDRVHRIGQDFGRSKEWVGAPMARKMIENHLAAVYPRRPDAVREVRIRMIRSLVEPASKPSRENWGGARAEERVLLQFVVAGGNHDA